MLIGIVLSSTPSYSETFFVSKIKGLQANGIEVILFVQNKNKDFELCKVIKQPKVYKKYPIIQIGFFFLVFFKLIPYFSTICRYVKLEKKQKTSFSQIIKNIYLNSSLLKHKLDWLHFGFATQTLGSELVSKAIGAKMAVSFRGFDMAIYPLKHPNCYKLLWKNIDKVHTISDDLLNIAYDLGLSKQVSVQKITPAIDTDFFTNKKLQVLSKKLHFLTVARLHWKKGIIDTLYALSIVKNKGYDFLYTIVGDGSDYERISYCIYELGLESHVRLVGKKNREEIYELYSKSNFYIQYSISEGFCNAVLEAQSMGLLSIVSNAEGLSENIENNKTGWVVPKNNYIILASKIIEVINFLDDKKIDVSKNAQERVRKYFTIEQQQKQFVQFYLNP